MFRKTLVIFLCSVLFSVFSAAEFRILAIGNSFSVCLKNNFPQIIHSRPPHRLIFTSAYIGGCSLEKHWECILQAQTDPTARPYSIGVWDSQNPARQIYSNGNVLNLLKNHQYDIITLQQASHFSWNPKTYQPYADQMIQLIRKYQPKAEIMIQQTWSYREDDPRISGPEAQWKFDQTGMYQRLTSAYQKLAARHHLKIIPVGKAVQIYRQRRPALATYLPKDVVGRGDTDKIHLNFHGEYLQACVWSAFIFGEQLLEGNGFYNNPQMTPEACAFLRECAAEAID